MKKWIVILSLLLVCLWGLLFALEAREPEPPEPQPPEPTFETIRETHAPTLPTAAPTTAVTEEPTETTLPPVYAFTAEEEELLLKLAMAERGASGCTDCIALVMRTVLNRVESPKFSSTIKGVIYAKDQFTPVADGTFGAVEPGWRCREALELVKQGWDDSQGALYYEWCEGESWHSQNLTLLFQHCDTRFYK